MSVVGNVLATILTIFLVLLIFRLVMEYVFMFARRYTPAGVVAVLLEVTYTVTDPPLKAVRRVLPPLRVGSVAVDLAFIVVFLVVTILISVFSGL